MKASSTLVNFNRMPFHWLQHARLIRAESLGGLAAHIPRNVVLYDGNCILQGKLTNWLLERNFGYLRADRNETNQFWFAMLQSVEGKRFLSYTKDIQKMDTIVLIERWERPEKYQKSKALEHEQAASSHPVLGRTTSQNKNALGVEKKYDLHVSTKSRAVLRCLQLQDRILMGWLGNFFWYCVPTVVCDAIYDYVARTRFDRYGKRPVLGEPCYNCDYPTEDFKTRVWKIRGAVQGR